MKASARGLTLIWSLLLAIALVLGALAIYQDKFPLPEVASRTSCAAVEPPPPGTIAILDPSVMRRSDALYSAIELSNASVFGLAVYLMAPAGDSRYAVAQVAPRQAVTISAPVGSYGLLLEYGTHWCGNERGYLDGEKSRAKTPIANKEGKTSRIQVDRRDARFSIAVSYDAKEPPKVTINDPKPEFAMSNAGFIDLKRDAAGHYWIDGAIEGQPIRFMVDTGATTTAISSDLARKLYIPSCRPVTSSTANGKVAGCIANVFEMAVGSFRIMNAEILILPNLVGNPLLGMNVLKHFNIEQRGNTMRLSYPGGPS